jgi:quinol monooxygenase YgiN
MRRYAAMPDPSRLIIARVHGVAAREGELTAAAHELAAACLAQPGCLSFDVLAQAGARSELVLVSAWASESAMRAHFASDAYADFTLTVTDLLTRPSDVTIHSVSGTLHPIADLSTEPRRSS